MKDRVLWTLNTCRQSAEDSSILWACNPHSSLSCWELGPSQFPHRISTDRRTLGVCSPAGNAHSTLRQHVLTPMLSVLRSHVSSPSHPAQKREPERTEPQWHPCRAPHATPHMYYSNFQCVRTSVWCQCLQGVRDGDRRDGTCKLPALHKEDLVLYPWDPRKSQVQWHVREP